MVPLLSRDNLGTLQQNGFPGSCFHGICLAFRWVTKNDSHNSQGKSSDQPNNQLALPGEFFT